MTRVPLTEGKPDAGLFASGKPRLPRAACHKERPLGLLDFEVERDGQRVVIAGKWLSPLLKGHYCIDPKTGVVTKVEAAEREAKS